MDASVIQTYIGIDVSKNWLDIAVVSKKYGNEIILQFRCDNKRSELIELKNKLQSNHILLNPSTLVLMEHSGFYAKNLISFLIKQKCIISLETPLQIKRSLGIIRGKSDVMDSHRIAQYAARYTDRLRIWQNPRQTILQLKDLLTLRERFTRVLKAIDTPLKDLTNFYSKKELAFLCGINKPASDGLKAALAKVTTEIRKIINKDRVIKKQVALLKSVPGIGIINALYLICVTHEFTITNSGKKLASYMGVAPFPYSSGSSIKGRTRVSTIANKKLKGLIHSAAVVTVRKKGAFRKYYNRKLSEGKHRMWALNAICNKILNRVSAVIKRGTPYLKQKKQ